MLLVGLGEGGPDDVEAVLAAALRMADAGTAAAGPGGFADRVVALLAVRRQLLVFDNCEHVLDETAGLVEAINLLVGGRADPSVPGGRRGRDLGCQDGGAVQGAVAVEGVFAEAGVLPHPLDHARARGAQ